MCLLTTNSTPCDHVECKEQLHCLTPQACFPPPTPSSALYLGLTQLNQLLLGMASQSAQVMTYLKVIGPKLVSYRKGAVSHFDFRYPDTRFYPLHLHLLGEEIHQVYKERGFPLTFQLLHSSGTPFHSSGRRCKVCLYSQDSPPKRISQNISGKKILRGTVETESDSQGLVTFPNIVVNEVSSHYPNDAFYLVVMSTSPDIQPYTVEAFSVRARKPMKRMQGVQSR